MNMRSGISLYPFMAGAETLTTTIVYTYLRKHVATPPPAGNEISGLY